MNIPPVFESVYYVHTSDSAHPCNPIAIRPKFVVLQLDDEWVEQRCEWQDTGRGTNVYFKQMIMDKTQESEKIPKKFKLIAENNVEFEFTYMTVDLFKEKIKHTAGLFNPTSDKQLQEYYLRTEFVYS